MKKTLLLLTIGMFAVVVATVHANEIVFQMGQDLSSIGGPANYTGVDDNFLISGSWGDERNSGGRTSFQVGKDGKKVAILRFDVSALAGVYANITSAKLELVSYNSACAETVKVSRIIGPNNVGWVEGTGDLTEGEVSNWLYSQESTAWDGSGGLGTAGTDYDSTPLIVEEGGNSAYGWNYFDMSGGSLTLTELFNTWTNTSNNGGMKLEILHMADDFYRDFRSSDYSDNLAITPKLRVFYAPIPEPGLIGIGAIAGLALLRRRA